MTTGPPPMIPYTMEEQTANGTRVFKRNIVYRSFRKTTEKAFCNIKKKVTEMQEEVKQRKALRTLNESFDSPMRPQRKNQRFQPYRASDMKKLKAATPDSVSRKTYRNPVGASCDTPGTPNSVGDLSLDLEPKFEYKKPAAAGNSRMDPIRQSFKNLKSKAVAGLGAGGGLKLQTTPETSGSRRWVSGRPCKLAARRKIEEMASPRRCRQYTPGKIQKEVNELAKGLEDLNALAAKLTRHP